MSTERAKKLSLQPEDDSEGPQAPADAGATAMPRLLTVRDLAAFLGVHEKTVYAWVERGSMPHYKIGGRVRFDSAQVQKWLRSRRGGV